MSQHQSFVRFEHDVQHHFRDQLNHAQSPEDARKAFELAMRRMLVAACGEQLRIYDDDIALQPAAEPHFSLSERLAKASELVAARQDSDLDAIFRRLAESAARRYQQLEQHPVRLQARIQQAH